MSERKYTNRRYLDQVEKKVVVFDGAMGTSLQLQQLTAEHFGGEKYNGCNDYLVISYPAAVEKVHRSFMEVGVDVLETDTFRSNRLTLGEYGLGEEVQGQESGHGRAHGGERLLHLGVDWSHTVDTRSGVRGQGYSGSGRPVQSSGRRDW